MTSNSERVIGSGSVITESRTVTEFTGVSVRAVGLVVLEKSTTESLEITAEDNILPLLASTVRDGILTLGPRSRSNLSPTREVVYRVTYRALSALEAAGVTRVEANGIETASLSATATGASTIRVEGRVDHQTVTLLGSSAYEGGRLAARTAAVRLAGTSRAFVNADERIEGDVFGASLLEHTGAPQLAVQTAGTAVVRHG